LTRRDNFQRLSEAQKAIILQVLESRKLLSSELRGAIQKSEATLQTHLTNQDVLLKQSMQTLLLDVSSSIQDSEIRTTKRFDIQDTHLKISTQKQLAQTEYMQRVERDAFRRRLLDALAYPEINDRRNMIEGRVGDFGQTYRWILEDSRYKRHKFLRWLQSDEIIFWISGKPGSGKSSLTSYIYHQLRPGGSGYAFLETWAQPQPVKVLAFWFFRPATSHLLKSLEGFWRSLCFQILDADLDLVQKIRVDASAPPALKSALMESGSAIRSWTDSELKEWFAYAIAESKFCYCILVDGLDEIEKSSDRELLVDAIANISRSSKRIKICCSSRPESPFDRALQQYPSLKLQDLNSDDIRSNCHAKLAGTSAEKFTLEVTARAQGVFLWAHLVAGDLRAASQRGDNEKDLERRLEETPDEMNELFTALLERQDGFYAKHPKPYLPLIQAITKVRPNYRNPNMSLFHLLVASHRHETSILEFASNLKDQHWLDLEKEAVHLESNLRARCAGLVEVHPQTLRVETGGGNFTSLPDYFPHKALLQADGLVANFIHRSVLDFLIENEKAKCLLQSCQMSEDDALVHLTAASALKFVVTRFSYEMDTITLLASLVQSQPGQIRVAHILLPHISAMAAELEKNFMHHRFVVRSADLTTTENNELKLLVHAKLSTAVIRYINNLEPRKVPFGALHALLQCVGMNALLDSVLIADLRPYLKTDEKYTMCYDGEPRTSEQILFTGYIWQHIGAIKVVEFFRNNWSNELQKVEIALDKIHWLNNVSDEANLHFDCWITLSEGERAPDAMPVPDVKTDYWRRWHKDRSIFHLKLGSRRPMNEQPSVAEFIGWSPRGLESSLDSPSPRNTMHVIWSQYDGFRDLEGSAKMMRREQAAMLCAVVDQYSPLSLATAVWKTKGLCYLASDGLIHAVNLKERELWEMELYQRRECNDHDAITSEIIRLMSDNSYIMGMLSKKATWLEYPELEDPEDYDLAWYDEPARDTHAF